MVRWAGNWEGSLMVVAYHDGKSRENVYETRFGGVVKVFPNVGTNRLEEPCWKG